MRKNGYNIEKFSILRVIFILYSLQCKFALIFTVVFTTIVLDFSSFSFQVLLNYIGITIV